MDSQRRAPGIEGFAHGRAELRFHNCLAPGKAWGDFTTQMEIEIGCLYHQKWGVKMGSKNRIVTDNHSTHLSEYFSDVICLIVAMSGFADAPNTNGTMMINWSTKPWARPFGPRLAQDLENELSRLGASKSWNLLDVSPLVGLKWCDPFPNQWTETDIPISNRRFSTAIFRSRRTPHRDHLFLVSAGCSMFTERT